MSETLLARVDGLPEVLLERERIYPVPANGAGNGRKPLSAKQRARIERQTAAVHTAVLPRSARRLLGERAVIGAPWLSYEGDRAETLAAFSRAGIL